MQNNKKIKFNHIPVLLKEGIDGLKISPSGIYLDCTLGGAGHSSEILKNLKKDGILIAFDKDLDAITVSSKRLSKLSEVFIYDKKSRCFKNNSIIIPSFESLLNFKTNKPISLIIRDDFKNSPVILKEIGIKKLDGILIDLGVSSYQIDAEERGFSFRTESDLDMRMDQSEKLTAKHIVNNYSEEELINLFYKYGEEKFSKSISNNIIKARQIKEIVTTKELNEIVEKSMPAKIVFSRGGASKKVFQALRIEVNKELCELDTFIKTIVSFLSKNSRICVISFHSLEDRIIKETFKSLSLKCICPTSFPKCVCNHKPELQIITKKPITASLEELKNNSRANSAKLRIAEKIKS